MRQAIVKCSMQFLRDVLKLPPETRILKVRQEWEDEKSGCFKLLVESPELHEVPECDVYPENRIEIHSDFCDSHEHSCIMGARVVP